MVTRIKSGDNDPQAAGARRELLEKAIFDQAARLFAERGYAGTTPQDIADAVGVTRQNLYYYVKSKEEILSRLVAEMATQNVEGVEALAASEGSAPDRLRRLARHLVLDRAAHGMRFQMLDRSQSALPPDLAERFLALRRAALAALVRVIEDGIAEGWFRGVDPRVAALSVIGMCNWVAWWYEPGHADPEEIADQIADGAVAMLSRGSRAAGDPHAIVDSIVEDLNRLKKKI